MKIVFKLVALLVVVCCSSVWQNACAQKQGGFWLFGEHCALNFSTGVPIFETGSNTQSMFADTEVGASSICDSSGDLLFYTNGQTIWDKTNAVMKNGDSIMGNISSTQSSLIVPQPGCSNFYYLFTTGSYQTLSNGLRYSVIDICENDQRGAVMSDKKNVLLQDTVAEKLCAMMDSTGNYWILVHKLFSDSFYAYYLTVGGITDSVVSAIGSVEARSAHAQQNAAAAMGQMKFSPDGKHVALVIGHQVPNVVEWYNFDQATGRLSNYNTTTISTQSGSAYGVEFSKNGSMLYVTNGDTLMQLNLMAGGGNIDSVNASKKIIFGGDGAHVYGMLLGPDNKIYVCMGDTTLSVIQSPDSVGRTAHFEAHAVSLNNNYCYRNLPDLIAGYHYTNKIPECNLLNVSHTVVNAACTGPSGSAIEGASGGSSPITIQWNTDPPQTGAQATNLLPGNYVATVTGTDPCFGPITVYDTIHVGTAQRVVAAADAFTPNGDGKNDIFIPEVKCSDELEYVFRIYNRWGQLLFETYDPHKGWDGSFNNKEQPVGVYVYYIEYTCGNCHDFKKGNITLLR